MKTLNAAIDSQMLQASGGRIDRAVQQLTTLSRAGVRGLIDHGCVSVNGTVCGSPQATIAEGDAVQVRFDPHRRYKESPKVRADSAFELLHEDEHVMVVIKSPHVLTVPTPREKGKTLVEAIERHLERNGKGRAPRKPHIVQRLDLGVSGVMVVAKSAQAASDLRTQFASHKPQRSYIAIVAGVLAAKRGTFRSHMATGRTLQRFSTKDAKRGELAVTHYEVLAAKRDATVVRVRLETGRRNQIRVHFAEAGHPVLGDRRYRPDLSAHPRWKAKRLALHAQSLEIAHPVTGKKMKFETKLPEEFAPFVRNG